MIKTLIKDSKFIIAKIVLLTIIFSGFGIGVLAFINDRLLGAKEFSLTLAVQFIVILIVFFITAVYANVTLTNFGHKLVFELRYRLIKRILDTPNYKFDATTRAKIIASLNSDIKTISFAFMSAPSLIQGSVFIVASSLYIFYISLKLFLFVAVWIGIVLVVGAFLMRKIRHYFILSRKDDDELQQSYNDIVEGHRELSLNRDRARICFDELNAIGERKRISMSKADIYHSISDNFTNIMLLGAVGICLFLCVSLEWASLQTAVTVSLAILFLRGSFIGIVSAIPATLSAKVSLEKIANLNIVEYQDGFKFDNILDKNWRKILFKDVSFSYADDKFSIRNLNLQINRGELVFVIGKNGSGKSTFSNILCGLLPPSSGEMYLDDVRIDDLNIRSYQSNISAVFTNFYLFSQAIGADGKGAEAKNSDEILALLEMDKKIKILDHRLSTTSLSQGQRKRLGLFIALLESRSLLVLDEWAADQDPIFKRIFYLEILPMLRDKGITIVAISHDDVYFDVADRIILVKDGIIRELHGDERKTTSKDAVEKLKE
ncbi:multidrug ABC transporter permease/ATP-binding protein [Campylobacter sp. faydin G-140]|uniref:multidrug ABC transporter permease/ATP-binding protein n=1 Tax=Campylobacter anatolicus TaxID=2829105 RepID=UPI001B9D836D|nr:multidrug ABC transporter permease/ATP-binding protein [Campylobacter anatolicus]MBR8465452.1 multidrug ABC transporter permease/ATP-binding protein [Campylobacter anatolicus]